jgi:precorrin-6B methylase 2
MKDRLVAMALPFSAGLALVAVVSSVAGLPEAAAVLLGLAVAIGLLGIQLRFDEVDRRASEHGPALHAALGDHARLMRQQAARLRRDIGATRAHLDMLPSDVVNLQRLVGEVVASDASLPSLGGQAVTARSILDVADEIRRAEGPVTIVDLGSGSSTVLDALVLQSTGRGGHVFALEADPATAAETRAALALHGVRNIATVVDAPLTQVKLPDGTASPWYAMNQLTGISEIDILFVDGPEGTAAGLARFPAFPLLAERLKPGALVVLDDTNRADEKAIVRLWKELEVAGRRLEVIREHNRSTVMRVVAVSRPAAAEPAPARKARKTVAKKAPAKRAAAGATKKTAAARTAKKAPARKAIDVEPHDDSQSPVHDWVLVSTEPVETTVRRTPLEALDLPADAADDEPAAAQA